MTHERPYNVDGWRWQMKRSPTTLLVIALCSAAVHADVTVVQKTTVETRAAVGVAGAGGAPPTITTRIKGMMSRRDVDTGATGQGAANTSTIIDVAARKVIILDHNRKTVRIWTQGAKPLAPAPATKANGVRGLKADPATSSGKSQTIDGLACDEYTFKTFASLTEFASGWEMPAVTAARDRRSEQVVGPDLAAAGDVEQVNDQFLVVKGSVWVSKDGPGVAEYSQYQKALAAAQIPDIEIGANGVQIVRSGKVAMEMQRIHGIPVLSVIGLSVDDRDRDPGIQILQMFGDTTMTTKLLSVKTDAIGDDAFKVPDGYRIIK